MGIKQWWQPYVKYDEPMTIYGKEVLVAESTKAN